MKVEDTKEATIRSKSKGAKRKRAKGQRIRLHRSRNTNPTKTGVTSGAPEE
jgi:hypothetical protein